jgi:putative transposase
MPEHAHLLISEPLKGTPSTVAQVLKQRLSLRLRGKRRRPAEQLNWFSKRRRCSAPLLAAPVLRFRRVEPQKRVEKLQYMHMNPLNRGLASHPKEWPWSSFLFYAKPGNGLIRVDPVR